MRNYRYIFLVIFSLFIVVPFIVDAEVKKIGDYKYTIENNSYNDYICDEIRNKQYRFFVSYDNANVVLSKVNEAPAYDYLIDFTKNNNCKSISQEEYNKLLPDVRYSYFWGKDDVVRKIKWSYDMDRYFILTSDTTVDKNKLYFDLVDLTFIEVGIPNDEDVATYYEEIYLEYVEEYDSNAIYYQDNYDGSATKVGKITEEKFKDGETYLIEVSNLNFEEVLKLNYTSFMVPKEVGIFGENFKYDRSDALEVITLDDKTFLMFTDENLGDPVVFDLDANLVKFGFDKVMSPSSFETTENDNASLMIGPTFKETKMYIMDSSFNVIFEEKSDETFIEYLTTIGNTDYFVIDSYIDPKFEKRIIELTKEGISNISVDNDKNSNVSSDIENPDTGDNILITILIGTMSLIGIIGLVVYMKKGKKRVK